MEHPPRFALIALFIAKMVDWLVNHLKPCQSVVFQHRVRAGCDKELRVLIHLFGSHWLPACPSSGREKHLIALDGPRACSMFGMSAYDNPPHRPVLEAEGCAK